MSKLREDQVNTRTKSQILSLSIINQRPKERRSVAGIGIKNKELWFCVTLEKDASGTQTAYSQNNQCQLQITRIPLKQYHAKLNAHAFTSEWRMRMIKARAFHCSWICMSWCPFANRFVNFNVEALKRFEYRIVSKTAVV